MRHRTENALPPLLDRIAYLGLLVVSPLVLPDLEKTSPVEAISGIPPDVPVLILAGGEDPVARPDEAQAILDRVRSHGRLVLFEHAGHMNFPETYPDLYQRSVLGFLREIKKTDRIESDQAVAIVETRVIDSVLARLNERRNRLKEVDEQGGIPVFRLSNIIMALIVGGFLFLALGSIEAGSSLSYTCVLCRLGRVDTTLFGFKRSTYHENECSRWYPQNVEPSHTHIWERGTCMTLLNVSRSTDGGWMQSRSLSDPAPLPIHSDERLPAFQGPPEGEGAFRQPYGCEDP